MKIYKSYKYRIYPTDTQKVLIEKHIGACRFIYNLALETRETAYKINKTKLSSFDLHKQLTDLRFECTWLNEISRKSLEASISNIDNAYEAFYKGGDIPSFKKKSNFGCFYNRDHVKIKNGMLSIAMFREGIKIIMHRDFDGKITSATISKTPTGKYFASLLVETEIQPLPLDKTSIGIDLGIKKFAVLSDGKEYASPKFLRKSLDRLKVLQRRASKKQRGSANMRKANLKVALIHEKITNQRKDFLHNISNEITNRYGTICIEDLATSNMVKNHCLALSISDLQPCWLINHFGEVGN